MSHPLVIMNKASFYIMFYFKFCYYEKPLWDSSDLLLDIPYLVLTTSVKYPTSEVQYPICRPKVLIPCYVWGSLRYHCFYCFFWGIIWRAFNWEKQLEYETRKIYHIAEGNTGLWFIISTNGTMFNFFEHDCFGTGEVVS